MYLCMCVVFLVSPGQINTDLRHDGGDNKSWVELCPEPTTILEASYNTKLPGVASGDSNSQHHRFSSAYNMEKWRSHKMKNEDYNYM